MPSCEVTASASEALHGGTQDTARSPERFTAWTGLPADPSQLAGQLVPLAGYEVQLLRGDDGSVRGVALHMTAEVVRCGKTLLPLEAAAYLSGGRTDRGRVPISFVLPNGHAGGTHLTLVQGAKAEHFILGGIHVLPLKSQTEPGCWVVMTFRQKGLLAAHLYEAGTLGDEVFEAAQRQSAPQAARYDLYVAAANRFAQCFSPLERVLKAARSNSPWVLAEEDTQPRSLVALVCSEAVMSGTVKVHPIVAAEFFQLTASCQVEVSVGDTIDHSGNLVGGSVCHITLKRASSASNSYTLSGLSDLLFVNRGCTATPGSCLVLVRNSLSTTLLAHTYLPHTEEATAVAAALARAAAARSLKHQAGKVGGTAATTPAASGGQDSGGHESGAWDSNGHYGRGRDRSGQDGGGQQEVGPGGGGPAGGGREESGRDGDGGRDGGGQGGSGPGGTPEDEEAEEEAAEEAEAETEAGEQQHEVARPAAPAAPAAPEAAVGAAAAAAAAAAAGNDSIARLLSVAGRELVRVRRNSPWLKVVGEEGDLSLVALPYAAVASTVTTVNPKIAEGFFNLSLQDTHLGGMVTIRLGVTMGADGHLKALTKLKLEYNYRDHCLLSGLNRVLKHAGASEGSFLVLARHEESKWIVGRTYAAHTQEAAALEAALANTESSPLKKKRKRAQVGEEGHTATAAAAAGSAAAAAAAGGERQVRPGGRVPGTGGGGQVADGECRETRQASNGAPRAHKRLSFDQAEGSAAQRDRQQAAHQEAGPASGQDLSGGGSAEQAACEAAVSVQQQQSLGGTSADSEGGDTASSSSSRSEDTDSSSKEESSVRDHVFTSCAEQADEGDSAGAAHHLSDSVTSSPASKQQAQLAHQAMAAAAFAALEAVLARCRDKKPAVAEADGAAELTAAGAAAAADEPAASRSAAKGAIREPKSAPSQRAQQAQQTLPAAAAARALEVRRAAAAELLLADSEDEPAASLAAGAAEPAPVEAAGAAAAAAAAATGEPAAAGAAAAADEPAASNSAAKGGIRKRKRTALQVAKQALASRRAAAAKLLADSEDEPAAAQAAGAAEPAPVAAAAAAAAGQPSAAGAAAAKAPAASKAAAKGASQKRKGVPLQQAQLVGAKVPRKAEPPSEEAGRAEGAQRQRGKVGTAGPAAAAALHVFSPNGRLLERVRYNSHWLKLQEEGAELSYAATLCTDAMIRNQPTTVNPQIVVGILGLSTDIKDIQEATFRLVSAGGASGRSPSGSKHTLTVKHTSNSTYKLAGLGPVLQGARAGSWLVLARQQGGGKKLMGHVFLPDTKESKALAATPADPKLKTKAAKGEGGRGGSSRQGGAGDMRAAAPLAPEEAGGLNKRARLAEQGQGGKRQPKPSSLPHGGTTRITEQAEEADDSGMAGAASALAVLVAGPRPARQQTPQTQHTEQLPAVPQAAPQAPAEQPGAAERRIVAAAEAAAAEAAAVTKISGHMRLQPQQPQAVAPLPAWQQRQAAVVPGLRAPKAQQQQQKQKQPRQEQEQQPSQPQQQQQQQQQQQPRQQAQQQQQQQPRQRAHQQLQQQQQQQEQQQPQQQPQQQQQQQEQQQPRQQPQQQPQQEQQQQPRQQPQQQPQQEQQQLSGTGAELACPRQQQVAALVQEEDQHMSNEAKQWQQQEQQEQPQPQEEEEGQQGDLEMEEEEGQQEDREKEEGEEERQPGVGAPMLACLRLPPPQQELWQPGAAVEVAHAHQVRPSDSPQPQQREQVQEARAAAEVPQPFRQHPPELPPPLQQPPQPQQQPGLSAQGACSQQQLEMAWSPESPQAQAQPQPPAQPVPNLPAAAADVAATLEHLTASLPPGAQPPAAAQAEAGSSHTGGAEGSSDAQQILQAHFAELSHRGELNDITASAATAMGLLLPIAASPAPCQQGPTQQRQALVQLMQPPATGGLRNLVRDAVAMAGLPKCCKAEVLAFMDRERVREVRDVAFVGEAALLRAVPGATPKLARSMRQLWEQRWQNAWHHARCWDCWPNAGDPEEVQQAHADVAAMRLQAAAAKAAAAAEAAAAETAAGGG